MGRITHYLIAFTALVAVTTTTAVQSTTYYKTKAGTSQQYYTVTGGKTVSFYVENLSPAVAAELVVFEPLKFKYPKPVNSGKIDNRLAFAQYHIDYNVATHYRS